MSMETQMSNKRRRLDLDGEAIGPSQGICSVPEHVVLKPDLWQLVVSFLETKTAGRLLLLTSKSWTTVASSDDEDGVWKLLLENLWGSVASKELLVQTGWSAETCLRLLGHGHFFHFLDEHRRDRPTTNTTTTSRQTTAPVESPSQVPRPLQYSPSDYLIVVTAKLYHEGKSSFLCKTIRGSDIPEFFATGKATIHFPNPLWKTIDKQAPLWSEAFHAGTGVCVSYTACVNLLRLPSTKRILLMGRNEASSFVGNLKDYRGNPHFQWDNDDGVLGWGPWLTMRSYGRPLIRKLHLRDYDYIRVHVVPHYNKTTTNKTNDSIGIFGFQLEAKLESMDDKKDVSDVLGRFQDVTFAHLLEILELRDWKQKVEEVKAEVRARSGRILSTYFSANPETYDHQTDEEDSSDDDGHDIQMWANFLN